MTFSFFHHVYVGCHTGAYPIVIETIWRWLVCVDNLHREDEPYYDISGRCHCNTPKYTLVVLNIIRVYYKCILKFFCNYYFAK